MAITEQAVRKIRNEQTLVAYLNSTLLALFLEVLGNKTLGLGALDFFMADFLRLNIPIVDDVKLVDALRMIGTRPIKDVWSEFGLSAIDLRSRTPNPLPDRKRLDDIVFDALGLTEDERNEVYWSVCELVQNRLNKAKSV